MPPSFPHILFDIDGTLTDDRETPQIDNRFLMGNALFELIADELHPRGVSRGEAAALFRNVEARIPYWDYDDFVRELKLPEPGIWERLTHWHRTMLRIYPDGVNLVHRLFRKGYPLHIVSNNPRTGCLLKLEAAGLGSRTETPFFKSIFCSNHQRGQKHSLSFWKRLLSHSGLNPESTLIVGNNLEEDYEVPRHLDFLGSFIVDRANRYGGQSTGAMLVSSLEEVDPERIPGLSTCAEGVK